jgi:hypothetical protein
MILAFYEQHKNIFQPMRNKKRLLLPDRRDATPEVMAEPARPPVIMKSGSKYGRRSSPLRLNLNLAASEVDVEPP